MTLRELWQWAVDNSVEDYEIYIGYRDGGGCYSGSELLKEYDIDVGHGEQEVLF